MDDDRPCLKFISCHQIQNEHVIWLFFLIIFQDDEDDEFEGVNTRPGGGPVYSTRQDEHNHSTRTDGNAYTLHDSAHFDQPAADVSAEHETSFRLV